MDVLEAIRGRRSVREYTAEPVGHELLMRLIEAAAQAPSAVNEQHWLFSVIINRATLNNIAAKAKAYMLEGAAEQPDHFKQTLSDPSFHIFYHAPALVVISAPAGAQWGVEDCALAAENLMLAAHAHGLGSCWIGFAQRWLETDEGRTAIELSKNEIAVAPIIVGHPKRPAPFVPRKKPNVRWIA